MSKWDKLLMRICSLSRDLRFDELRKVLESYGYKMNAPRSGSSHYTFRKSGCQPITIPKHEPIKKVYVELVRQIVESEGRNDEDANSHFLRPAGPHFPASQGHIKRPVLEIGRAERVPPC